MDIDELRRLDLAAVCAVLGLEPDSADKKQFKTEGFRVCVNGFKWFDHGAGKGSGGAIDLIMHVKQLSFMGACAYLDSVGGELSTATRAAATQKAHPATTRPPTPHLNNLPAVLAYLAGVRGLNAALVQWCITSGLIYADSRRNCVFRYGSTGAELRGTGGVQWRSVYGTIESGFILPAPSAVGVALLESAIDAMSYRQLHRDVIAVSIAGNGNHKVINQAVGIAKVKNIPVICAFDNDKGGDSAANILHDSATRQGVAIRQDRPAGKDWNDALK